MTEAAFSAALTDPDGPATQSRGRVPSREETQAKLDRRRSTWAATIRPLKVQ